VGGLRKVCRLGERTAGKGGVIFQVTRGGD